MVELRPEVVAVMVQIIDKAASKGMFVGNEITTVGTVRAQLVEELEKIRPAESAPSDVVKAKIPASEK
jgi:hypothetical protein